MKDLRDLKDSKRAACAESTNFDAALFYAGRGCVPIQGYLAHKKSPPPRTTIES